LEGRYLHNKNTSLQKCQAAISVENLDILPENVLTVTVVEVLEEVVEEVEEVNATNVVKLVT